MSKRVTCKRVECKRVTCKRVTCKMYMYMYMYMYMCLHLHLSLSLSFSLSLGRTKSETGCSSVVPDQAELAFLLRPSHRRWITKPCLGARFRATAVREHSHIASTTESASRHTEAVSLFTGPATDRNGSVPAYWEQ